MKIRKCLYLLPLFLLASCGEKTAEANEEVKNELSFSEVTKLDLSREKITSITVEKGNVGNVAGSLRYIYRTSDSADLDKAAKFFDMKYKDVTSTYKKPEQEKYYIYTFETDTSKYDVKFENGIYTYLDKKYQPDQYFDFTLDYSSCTISIDLAFKNYSMYNKKEEYIKSIDNAVLEQIEYKISTKELDDNAYEYYININGEDTIYIYNPTTIKYKGIVYEISNNKKIEAK